MDEVEERHRRPDEPPRAVGDILYRVGRVALGGGAAGFAAWGILHPASLAAATKLEPSSARLIGFRDAASAVLILGPGGPLAYATRAVWDFGDAVVLAPRRPGMAAGAAAAGVVGLAMAVASAARAGGGRRGEARRP